MTHPETGEFYIGRRTSNLPPNEDSYRGSSKTWYSQLTKDTIHNVLVKEIIDSSFQTQDELNLAEANIIKENIENPLCRNSFVPPTKFIRIGPLSIEHKQKISKAMTGVPKSEESVKSRSSKRRGTKASDETRKKQSESHKGIKPSEETKKLISENSYWKTDEGRNHMSMLKKGLKKSDTHKENLSKSLKGRVFSDDTKNKMSEARKGKTHSEETKRKMSEARKKRELLKNSQIIPIP